MQAEDGAIERWNEAARQASEAAKRRTQEQKRAEAAASAQHRREYLRKLTDGERNTQEELRYQQYQG